MDRERLPRRIARIAAAAAVLLVLAGPAAMAPAAAAEQGTTNGVVVRWHRASQTYQTPAPEQAAVIFEELQRSLEGGLAARLGLETGSVAVKTLPNGLHIAPVPTRFLNLSVVRVGVDGSFAGVCSQGPEDARESLEHPETGSGRPLR